MSFKLTNDTIGEQRAPLLFPIIEDWNRGTADYYSGGDTDGFEIQSSTVLEGPNALALNEHTGPNLLSSNFDCRRGFAYSVFINFETHDSQANQRVFWGISQSEFSSVVGNDGYNFRVEKDNEQIRIFRRDGGSGTSLAVDDALSIPTDEWLKMDMVVGFESIEFTLEQLDGTQVGQAIADDTTYQDPGFMALELDSRESGKQNFVDNILRRPL